jgi:hypothetical protein
MLNPLPEPWRHLGHGTIMRRTCSNIRTCHDQRGGRGSPDAPGRFKPSWAAVALVILAMRVSAVRVSSTSNVGRRPYDVASHWSDRQL